MLRVEVSCNPRIHRARVSIKHEARPGTPDWQAVEARPYDPWTDADLHLSTSAASDPAAAIIARLTPSS